MSKLPERGEWNKTRLPSGLSSYGPWTLTFDSSLVALLGFFGSAATTSVKAAPPCWMYSMTHASRPSGRYHGKWVCSVPSVSWVMASDLTSTVQMVRWSPPEMAIVLPSGDHAGRWQELVQLDLRSSARPLVNSCTLAPSALTVYRSVTPAL